MKNRVLREMPGHRGFRRAALVCAGLAVVATGAIAQGQRGNDVPYCYTPEQCPETPYDGRFTFVRVYFETGGGGFGRRGGGGEPSWHHDRPYSERNLSNILREISAVRAFDGPTGGNVYALDDPEIFRYPVLWLAEAGFWQPTDEQVKALRAYLLKGGFMIFDDFSNEHWGNFAFQMSRVLPELQPVVLDGSEAIFHSFFDINPAELSLGDGRGRFGGGGAPVYLGIFEDNDKRKRQLVMINYNNDVGEYMDYNATGFVPVDLSNEAYKLGVNYIMYPLTH